MPKLQGCEPRSKDETDPARSGTRRASKASQQSQQSKGAARFKHMAALSGSRRPLDCGNSWPLFGESAV